MGTNIDQLLPLSDIVPMPSNPVDYAFQMEGPSKIMPICEEIEIRMVNITNDGLRGPKTISWTLFSYTPDTNPTHKADIIAFL